MPGGGQTTQQSSTSEPWAVQQPYLKQAFSGAQTALGQAQQAKAPTDFTAQFTPDQIAAFSKMLQYGTGNDAIPGSSAAAGGALTGAGSNAVSDALAKLQGYKPGGGFASDMLAGNQYVQNMNIPALVKAAMLPANQEASEETLPSIARAAAGSGNINSSRNAIQQGIVQRGLAQQAEGIGAQLQQEGFNTGAALNETNTQASNQNLLSSILGALSGGNTAVGTGVNANTGAVGQQGALFDIANSGVAGEQTAAQAPLTNQQQQFEAQTNDPFAALQNFYNIVGMNNWGGTSTGTSTSQSQLSPFQVIGGLLTAGGAFLHSDARLKTDIQAVGQLDNGLTVYSYRYVGQKHVHIGLLAHEVEKLRPEAVREDAHGFKMVNYELATQ